MKKLMMGAIVAVGCLTPGAHAVFTGLTLELHTTTTPEQTEGIARDVYRLYANFTQPNEHLGGIYGNAASPFTLDLNGNTSYNPSFGGNLPLTSETLPQHPSAAFDCYVTLGAEAGYSPNYNMFLSPNFPAFVNAPGIFEHTNMAWYSPPQPPNAPGASGRVLIMQIAVTAGGASPSGSLGVNYLLNGKAVAQVHNQAWAIPAPSALSWIMAVGVIGGRRHRCRS